MTEQNKPALSIIIPTLNGADGIARIMKSLQAQTCRPDEILVIDSSSSDATLQIAHSFGARTIGIERDAFDHGGTRSMAAEMARGDILVFMTQDAIPVDSNALANLVSPFADQKVAAVYGRQMPNPDADCFAVHLRQFNYPDHSSIHSWEDRHQLGFRAAFISNSFAAYRKTVLASIGFFRKRMLFGEDTFTVAKLLCKGYCVAYAADALVYHSHNHTLLQDFRRYFDIGVVHAQNRDVLESFGSIRGEGKRYVRSELSFLIRRRKYLRLPESLLRNGLKLLAYTLGKRYKHLPRPVAANCSMNRKWWKTNA